MLEWTWAMVIGPSLAASKQRIMGSHLPKANILASERILVDPKFSSSILQM